MGMFSKGASDSEARAEARMKMQADEAQLMLKQEYMRTQVEIARQQMNNVGMADAAAYQKAANGLRPGEYLVNAGMAGAIRNSSISNASTWQDPKPPRRDANKNPAMKMSMTALVDLTRAKFGEEWLDTQAPVGTLEDFWETAFVRLSRANKLEDVNGWVRLKEDA